MKSQQVQYQDEKYRYNSSLLDVFSRYHRYHWLEPLTSKHSSKIAVKLRKIHDIHETPGTLPRDRGKEFYGAVKRFCKHKKIKMTKSRAYHHKRKGKRKGPIEH